MVFSIKRKRKQTEQSPDGSTANGKSRRNKILLLILIFTLLASNLFLFNKLKKTKKIVVTQQQEMTSTVEPADASSEVGGKWYGICAKNSIHSIEDFRNLLENDPLLAKYYADFDWKNARMGTLEETIWRQVGYRKNLRISTTRKPIRLPKGDGYITDGKRWLRTYCCNDYVLNIPSEAVDSPDRLLPTSDDQAAGPDRQNPTEKLTEKEILVVPEPSSILLLGSGIGFLGLRWRHRRLNK